MRPAAFVLASTEHGTMIVNRNDWHQLPNGGIYGVGYHLLAHGAYDVAEVADIKTILDERRAASGDDLVVLDCGANIGVQTLEMARHMSGWGHVFAFEAQDRLYYALCGNLALNNIENATAYWVALSSEPGVMDIPQVDYNKPGSFGSLELRHRPGVEYIGQPISYTSNRMKKIAVSSIDSYSFHRLDFIKMDVEGMELEVLEGARRSIASYRPHMLIEWIKTDRSKLESVLSSFGYDFVEVGLNLKATPKL
jgi:FkbM family methyltransferase